jgi:hypothetical protein
MTIEKLCSFYWGKNKLIKITRYAEKSFRAVHERYLGQRGHSGSGKIVKKIGKID